MKVIALFTTITGLLFVSNAYSADAANGAKLFSSCIECHGQSGAGNEASLTPKITGQYDWYIVTSLKNYKKGARKHPAMSSLSEQDMQDLAAHISRLK